MKTQTRQLLQIASIAASILLCTLAFAQQPVAAPPVAPANAVAPSSDASNEAAEQASADNPAVRAALELPREHPSDYFQAIVWLIDLGHPELAQPILEQLNALSLNDQQRAALVAKFGSAGMLKLARAKALAPLGEEFAKAAMNAASAEAQSPQRLNQLIGQLADPSPENRHAARADLTTAGQVGVNATLEALARETDPERREALVVAAARMRPLVVAPLLAMLATNDAALQHDVTRLLQHLGTPQAVPFLPADTATAEAALLRALEDYKQGAILFAPDEQGQVTLWHWDDATKKLHATRHDASAARTIWMARLARRLAEIRADSRAFERRALVLGLEADGLLAASTTDEAIAPSTGALHGARDPSQFDSPALSAALDDALKQDFSHASIAIARELGSRRDAGVLLTYDGQPSPLAQALRHRNRRVRYAALEAIMAIDPASPYPGASHFAEALAYFVASAGQRRAVVAAPTAAKATDLAGALAKHELDAVATNQGNELVQLARQMSDLELIFVDADIQSPDVRQVVYELRILPTTGEIPIALLAGEGRLPSAQRIAAEHERVIAAPRPHTPETTARIVDELRKLARDEVGAPQRAEQASQAMSWLAALLASDRDFYALRRFAPSVEASLYRAATSEPAIAALGLLGTPSSQRALVDHASQSTLPIASRRASATAFYNSVQRHGVLLTSEEITTQYDRYNASASADADTQKVLSVLLDAIEARRASQSNKYE